MTIIESNTEVAKKFCKALNIPFDHIRDIQISVRFDAAPTLIIDKILTASDIDSLATVLEEYELVKKQGGEK